jgi:hypothetical protein
LTTTQGIQLSTDALSTGNAFYVESTSTALADGALNGGLARYAWNPGSTDSTDADLFVIDINGNATVTGNLFAVYNNGSDVFTVSQTEIESAVPHAFTAAGDVSVAYDINFTNQTASQIESYGPFSIVAGESFENNNLTLTTYGTGDILLNATGTIIAKDDFSLDAQQTFTDSDATPDVSAGSHFITNTSAVEITDFDAGSGSLTAGHFLVIESAGAITYDYDAGNLNLGAADIVTAAGDITAWIYDGTDWNLISWMDDSDTQTGADLAEYYVSSEPLEPGDVVSLDINEAVRVKKSTIEFDPFVIGIVSHNPGLILGEAEQNAFLIALAGRVEVNMDPNSPAIEPGDYIAASANGKGTKATQAGKVIGQAMQAWDPETSTAAPIVFIEPGYYDPQPMLILDSIGQIQNDQQSINSQIGNIDQALRDIADQTKASAAALDQVALLQNTLNEHASAISTYNTKYNLIDANLATHSAQIQSADTRLTNVEATLSLLQDFVDVIKTSADTSSSSSFINPLAAGTENLSFNTITQTEEELQINQNLRVLGTATLEDTTIIGNLNVGLLSFNDLNTSINALGQELRFQNQPLAGNINAFNGKIVMTPVGNITVEGRVSAKEVTAQKAGFGDLVTGKLTIATQSAALASSTALTTEPGEATDSATPLDAEPVGEAIQPGPSIGTATLPADQRAVYVETAAVSANSKIFITPASLTSAVLGVTKIDPGQGFWVETTNTVNKDLRFNWWIIDVVANAKP